MRQERLFTQRQYTFGVRMEKEGRGCYEARGRAGRVWQTIGGTLGPHEVSSYLDCFPPHPAVEFKQVYSSYSSWALSNIPKRMDSSSSLYKSLLELRLQGGQKSSWVGTWV